MFNTDETEVRSVPEKTEQDDLRDRLARAEARIEDLMLRLWGARDFAIGAEAELGQIRAELAATRAERDKALRQRDQARLWRDKARTTRDAALKEKQALAREVEALRASTSWRLGYKLTRPAAALRRGGR